MAVVKQNRTRYNTDDILALLGWFEKKMHNLGLVQAGELELGWRAQQVALWRPPSEGINLGSVSPQEVVLGECVSFNHSKLPQGWRRKGGLPCLKIIAPKNLPDDDPGRALLMAAKDIRPHLPDSGAREVLRWYYAAGTMSHEKIRDHGQTVLDLIKTASFTHQDIHQWCSCLCQTPRPPLAQELYRYVFSERIDYIFAITRPLCRVTY